MGESLLSLVLIRRSDDVNAAPQFESKHQSAPDAASPQSRSQNGRTCSDVLDRFILRDSVHGSLTVKASAKLYLIIFIAVYQGLCQSSAFVLSVMQTPNATLSTAETAAASVAFVSIVGVGFIAVWAALLACVRPQERVVYDTDGEEWVGTDQHSTLLQNVGALFQRYRNTAGRYLFGGFWMLNLLCLGLILTLAEGTMQLYLMIGNEAWIGILYLAWAPHPSKSKFCGSQCKLNYNVVHAVERLIAVVVLCTIAFFPVEGCDALPEWATAAIVLLALVPTIIPLFVLVGSALASLNRKCSGASEFGSIRKDRIAPAPKLAPAPRRTLADMRKKNVAALNLQRPTQQKVDFVNAELVRKAPEPQTSSRVFDRVHTTLPQSPVAVSGSPVHGSRVTPTAETEDSPTTVGGRLFESRTGHVVPGSPSQDKGACGVVHPTILLR